MWHVAIAVMKTWITYNRYILEIQNSTLTLINTLHQGSMRTSIHMACRHVKFLCQWDGKLCLGYISCFKTVWSSTTGRYVALFPGSCVGEEERQPGTHYSRMHQVPLVTCILLRYTKITVNFCLPAERPHCMVILPVGHIRVVLKSKTTSLWR